MVALGAPEEPDLALIGSPELAEPPDSQVVCALGTLDLDGRHSLHFLFFIIDNPDLPFLPDYFMFHIVCIFNFPYITTFPAFQLTPGRY
jgi:hypothetical protein